MRGKVGISIVGIEGNVVSCACAAVGWPGSTCSINLDFHLFELPWRAESPGYPERCTTTNSLGLINNRWPPTHEVLSLAPIGRLPPLPSQTKDRKATFPERFSFDIAFRKPVLGNNGPAALRLQGCQPANITLALNELVLERNNTMAINLG